MTDTDNVPEWLIDRAEDAEIPTGMALRVEIGHAIDVFGLPLPEVDPYEVARRRREQQRIERIERHLRIPTDPDA